MAYLRGPATNGIAQPAYGMRMLPQTLDDLAEIDPERTLGCIAKSSDISMGFTEVKMRDMARVVNHCAWWLEERIGRSRAFETLGIMEIADFRYTALFLAAVKLGYKLLAPSPRNTQWMNSALLDQTDCVKILIPEDASSVTPKLPSERDDLVLVNVPSFGELLKQDAKHYRFDKTWNDGKWDPVLILHSSGTTGGPPKPIILNHGSFAALDNERNLPPISSRRIQSTALFNFPEGGYYYSSPLPAHLSGFLSMVMIPIFSTTATVVLGPVDIPPSGKVLREILRFYPLRGTFAAPNIIEEFALESDGLKEASKFDFLLFMGGPLAATAGDHLSKVVTLCQFYGSTETLEIATLIPASEDWAYIEFHPSIEADMQPIDDNISELVFHQNQNPQPRFGLDWTYPNIQHWHTKDLFRRHPSKPNLWHYHGRIDDLVVLATAAKFNPVPSENLISDSPLLTGALISGQGRTEAALLIEPRPGVERATVVEKIWPLVEHMNKEVTSVARIRRDLIAVATPDKPFRRTQKGTIMRKQSLEDYSEELNCLYAKSGVI
ncbi:MAG: hypothetical protein MMC33_002208 [Icmadophila ericetorum]|nr:hypothetical protein [Icmadophila ericetorum]